MTYLLSTAVLGWLLWSAGGPAQRVAITESDALWLARMVVGSQEGAARTGGPAAAARMWCAANRHVLQCDRDRRSGRACRWRSFSQSFRAYSTAISPQWSAHGWCAPGGRLARSRMCSPARLARRARVTSLDWRTIDRRYPPLREIVRAFARGALPAPRGLERVAHTDCLGCSRAPRGAVRLGSNWWSCDRESCAWPDGYVRIVEE